MPNLILVAAPPRYSLSGTVTSAGGVAVSGITVSLSGAGSGSTTTDGSGNYSFSGLLNGSYTVTPTKSGYTYSPANSSRTVSGANVTAVNFAQNPIGTFTGTTTASTLGISDGSSTNSGYIGHTVTCHTAGVLSAGTMIGSVRSAGVNGSYNMSTTAITNTGGVFDVW